jgi:hypothetical protein
VAVADREEEVIIEAGDEDLTPAEEELAEILDETDSPALDQVAQSQDIHDTQVARSIRAKAIAHMDALGVSISPDENREALGLFPKVRTRISVPYSTLIFKFAYQVAGLAKKVHDSGTVGNTFNSLVDAAKAAKEIQSDKTALDRRCPTRWNSEFACLTAHQTLKIAVEQLTATSSLKLSAFKLSETQWDLSEEVTAVLTVSRRDPAMQTKANLYY